MRMVAYMVGFSIAALGALSLIGFLVIMSLNGFLELSIPHSLINYARVAVLVIVFGGVRITAIQTKHPVGSGDK